MQVRRGTHSVLGHLVPLSKPYTYLRFVETVVRGQRFVRRILLAAMHRAGVCWQGFPFTVGEIGCGSPVWRRPYLIDLSDRVICNFGGWSEFAVPFPAVLPFFRSGSLYACRNHMRSWCEGRSKGADESDAASSMREELGRNLAGLSCDRSSDVGLWFATYTETQGDGRRINRGSRKAPLTLPPGDTLPSASLAAPSA